MISISSVVMAACRDLQKSDHSVSMAGVCNSLKELLEKLALDINWQSQTLNRSFHRLVDQSWGCCPKFKGQSCYSLTAKVNLWKTISPASTTGLLSSGRRWESTIAWCSHGERFQTRKHGIPKALQLRNIQRARLCKSTLQNLTFNSLLIWAYVKSESCPRLPESKQLQSLNPMSPNSASFPTVDPQPTPPIPQA